MFQFFEQFRRRDDEDFGGDFDFVQRGRRLQRPVAVHPAGARQSSLQAGKSQGRRRFPECRWPGSKKLVGAVGAASRKRGGGLKWKI